MKINTRQSDGVTILDTHGKITIEKGCKEIRDTVENLLEAGNRNMLINLDDVSFIDSSAVGELLRAKQKTEDRGGRFKLLHLTDRQRKLLIMTSLITKFDYFDNEADGVASF